MAGPLQHVWRADRVQELRISRLDQEEFYRRSRIKVWTDPITDELVVQCDGGNPVVWLMRQLQSTQDRAEKAERELAQHNRRKSAIRRGSARTSARPASGSGEPG